MVLFQKCFIHSGTWEVVMALFVAVFKFDEFSVVDGLQLFHFFTEKAANHRVVPDGEMPGTGITSLRR